MSFPEPSLTSNQSSFSESSLRMEKMFPRLQEPLSRSYGTRHYESRLRNNNISETWWNDNLRKRDTGFFSMNPYHMGDYSDKAVKGVKDTLIPVYDIRNSRIDTNDYSKETDYKELTKFNIFYGDEKFIIADEDNHALAFFSKTSVNTVWGYLFALDVEESQIVPLPRTKNYPMNHYMSIYKGIPTERHDSLNDDVYHPPKTDVLFYGYLGGDMYKESETYFSEKKKNKQGEVKPEDPRLLKIGTIRVIQSKKYGLMIVDDNFNRLYHYVFSSYATHFFEIDDYVLLDLRDKKMKELGMKVPENDRYSNRNTFA